MLHTQPLPTWFSPNGFMLEETQAQSPRVYPLPFQPRGDPSTHKQQASLKSYSSLIVIDPRQACRSCCPVPLFFCMQSTSAFSLLSFFCVCRLRGTYPPSGHRWRRHLQQLWIDSHWFAWTHQPELTAFTRHISELALACWHTLTWHQIFGKWPT